MRGAHADADAAVGAAAAGGGVGSCVLQWGGCVGVSVITSVYGFVMTAIRGGVIVCVIR